MTMDDLVSVQIFCTDLKLYDTFNKVYRTYFHGIPCARVHRKRQDTARRTLRSAGDCR